MEENKILDILKGAILLEHRGKSLYDSVVQSTHSDEVRELFQFLSGEEEKHIAVLEKQYKNVTQNQGFSLDDSLITDWTTSKMVLNNRIVEEVSGAGYEAAVISAALGFEKNAVAYYSDRASQANSAGEKKLYKWLSEWEKSHMNLLAELDRDLKERIWYDNSFWPM